MGERAEAGSLIYTVLESEWHGRLGDGGDARMPRNQYLVLRLSITNSGAAEATIPPTALIDAGGRKYEEERNGEGVPQWLGVLRKVKPAETETGRVVFDAPRGDYQLQVSDDAFDPADVEVALIQIPLRFETGASESPR